MRSGSTSLLLGAALLLAACARPAPPLPTVDAAVARPLAPLSEEERLARCAILATGIATARKDMLEIEQVIAGRRTREQVTAYLAAVLYPPLLSSMDRRTAQRRILDQRQAEIDRSLVERQARGCPPAGTTP